MIAPVDLQNLREITGGDASMEKELFHSFLETSAECLAGLQVALRNAENNLWRQKAHALKGVSLNLGAVQLGELCREAQDKFEASASEKQQLLVAIQGEFGNVRGYLENIDY